MKQTFSFLCFLLCLGLLGSCNQEEGLGGASTVEGYVYNIVHYNDNISFRTDTFPASKEDVYLIFGNNMAEYFGDDVETNQNGLFRFNYLRTGNYLIYAYSKLANGDKEVVYNEIKVANGLNKADTLFIHTGKAYGTAIIRGEVYATYYHNGSYRAEGPATGMRAFIKHEGEDVYFDDVRVSNGTFFFQGLRPGKYEVAVVTEDKSTESVSLKIQTITITTTGIIYDMPETFRVDTSV